MSEPLKIEPTRVDEYPVLDRKLQFSESNDLTVLYFDGQQMRTFWLPDVAVRALGQILVDRGIVRASA